MKQIDNLLVTTSGGTPSLNTYQVLRALRDAGFKEGDLVSVVLTSDLSPTRVLQVEDVPVNGGRGAVRGGQRRRFSLDPQSIFRVLGRNVVQPQYWRCSFDGGRVVEYLESYIEARSLLMSEEVRPARKIFVGQRRILSHDPQQPFTIASSDHSLPGYWRVEYDGDPERTATFGEEYILKRSTVVEETPPAPPAPAFQWWACYQSYADAQIKDGRECRVLARTAEDAQRQANSQSRHGSYCVVVPL